MNDDYLASDMAWMDMKNNQIDVVIGPIETYEDQLFGYKASHECYVLIKDMEWSGRLAKYAAFLPELQEALPVEAPYKKEKPGPMQTSMPMMWFIMPAIVMQEAKPLPSTCPTTKRSSWKREPAASS